jgi:hypothetical protein
MIDRGWRGAGLGGLVLVALLIPSGTEPWAQGRGAFEVSGVAVDVTAETAAAAREKALLEGEARAFRHLLERLTLRGDHDRLPDLGGDEISTYVLDFAIAEEKTSAVRYLARLDFRFKADDVRRLLTDYGLRFAETSSKPLLVLPVYQAVAAMRLWDDPNPWLEAWKALPPADGLVPLVLPLGDLMDIAAIGVDQAVNGDVQRLAAVAGRYNTADVLVARAILRTGVTGLPEIEVVVSRHGSVAERRSVVAALAAQPGETVEAVLRRAAAQVSRQVEDRWKRDNLLLFDQSAVVAVIVPIAGLAIWLDVRGRLAGVAVVQRVDLVLLSRDEVRVNLHYIGEHGQLIVALKQADLDLSRQGDDWILSLSGGGKS